MSIETFVDNLKWRYATKSFDSTQKIPKDLLNQLLETMRLAPSSFGLQPWKFFVVENSNVREELKAQAWNQPQITECSLLIVFANRSSIDADYINSYADRIAKERQLTAAEIAGYRNMMLDSLPMMQGQAGQAWMTKQIVLRTNGTALRDFLWLGDVSRVVRELLEHGEGKNNIYNLASAQAMSILDFVQSVASAYEHVCGSPISILRDEQDASSPQSELKIETQKLQQLVTKIATRTPFEEAKNFFKLLVLKDQPRNREVSL